MVRSSTMLPLLTALLFSNAVAAENDDVIAVLKGILTIDPIQEWHEDVKSTLRESGLSQSDAERITSDLSSDATECVFGAIAQAMDRHSISVEDIPRDTTKLDLGFFFQDESEFGELVVHCISLAVEKAGLLEN